MRALRSMPTLRGKEPMRRATSTPRNASFTSVVATTPAMEMLGLSPMRMMRRGRLRTGKERESAVLEFHDDALRGTAQY